VIVLDNGVVGVLELKEKIEPSEADIDQVFAYAHDRNTRPYYFWRWTGDHHPSPVMGYDPLPLRRKS